MFADVLAASFDELSRANKESEVFFFKIVLTWCRTLIFQVVAWALEDLTKGLWLSSAVVFGESADPFFVVVVGTSAGKRDLHQAGLCTLVFTADVTKDRLDETLQKSSFYSLKSPQPFDSADLLVLFPMDAQIADFFEKIGRVGEHKVVPSSHRINGVGRAPKSSVVQAERLAGRLLSAQIDTISGQGLVGVLKKGSGRSEFVVEIGHG